VNIHSRSRIPRFIVLIVTCLTVVCAFAQSPPQYEDPQRNVERVFELIEQRLALMPEVAASKWHAGQNIVDAVREQTVLDQSVRDAQAIGLAAPAARQFFDVQIRMARAIQEQRFKEWRASTPPPRGRDLATELRPALDRLGPQLLTGLYLASGKFGQTAPMQVALERLRGNAGITSELVNELRDSLLAMRIDAVASFDIVKRVGVLRVGTTGDYAPFSSDRDGTLRGFDIQLALALARHWNVDVQFVRTSWPTLMSDLANHRFDIAASGISVTPDRDAVADFSVAYHVDGKMPIARCAERAKYQTLAGIDREGVRVIVNPGGTNEAFVRERIKRARVLRHADNRTIFEEIVAGRADAMFTDAIEVELQSLRHPELCAVMSNTLTRAPKALLIPQGSTLRTSTDEWLAARVKTGELKSLLQSAVIQEAALPARDK